jgi:hypothetical protein
MKVNEDLSILFWLKREKATKEGLLGVDMDVTATHQAEEKLRQVEPNSSRKYLG